MCRNYIKNNRTLNKRQNRINKLLKKPYNTLTIEERLEVIYDKYYKRLKITYEEYVFLTLTNDELWFLYKDNEYMLSFHYDEYVSMLVTEYKDGQKSLERVENFSSIFELLDKFKIEDKTIKEVWEDVTF